jgi:Spy/CpxP family protein refolding chaperone
MLTFPPRSRPRLVLCASFLATGLAGALIGGVSIAAPPDGHHAASLPGSPIQYEALTDEHLKHLFHTILAKVSEEQRLRLVEVGMRAKSDLDELEQRARTARAPRRDILLADAIDRQALEQVRLAEMRVAEERSRRVDAFLVALVSVLTPQQRASFLAELRSHRH